MRIIEQSEQRIVIADEKSSLKLIMLLLNLALVIGVVALILIFAPPDSEIYGLLWFIPAIYLLGLWKFRFHNLSSLAHHTIVIDKEGKPFTFRSSLFFSKEKGFPLSQVGRTRIGTYEEEVSDSTGSLVKAKYWEVYFEIP